MFSQVRKNSSIYRMFGGIFNFNIGFLKQNSYRRDGEILSFPLKLNNVPFWQIMLLKFIGSAPIHSGPSHRRWVDKSVYHEFNVGLQFSFSQAKESNDRISHLFWKSEAM